MDLQKLTLKHIVLLGLMWIGMLIQTSTISSLSGKDQDQIINNGSSYIPFSLKTVPHTIFFEPSILAEEKAYLNKNEDTNPQISKKLISEANTFLIMNPVSVINKTKIPPSGNKHDFLSLTPYRWPDPRKPHGLPYVFYDGKINPEIYSIPDKGNLDDMIYRVKTLSLAYYFTEKQEYASKAAELLRMWFLNNSTYMNPNLTYAETVPGKDQINPSGIMAGTYISSVLDAVTLIQDSKSWTNDDQRGINLWFNKYLDWLLYSEAVGEEIQKINNHGTYYDVQISSIALYLNKTDIARKVILSATQELTPISIPDIHSLIAVKIQPNGQQPFELQRSKSLDYSIFNLLGMFKLASVGQNLGIDLWNFKTKQGAGLKKALDYLLPFALKKQIWPYQQIEPIRSEYLVDLLCQATLHYPKDRTYLQMYKSMYEGVIPSDNGNYHVCMPQFDLHKETDPGSVEAEIFR